MVNRSGTGKVVLGAEVGRYKAGAHVSFVDDVLLALGRRAQRFVVVQEQSGSNEVVVVLNWFANLGKGGAAVPGAPGRQQARVPSSRWLLFV